MIEGNREVVLCIRAEAEHRDSWFCWPHGGSHSNVIGGIVGDNAVDENRRGTGYALRC